MQLTNTLKKEIKNYKLGKITEAIKCFESSVNENEKNELVHECLGICYMEKGKYEKSIKNFLRVLNLNNNNYKSTLSIINLLNFIKAKIYQVNPVVFYKLEIKLINMRVKNTNHTIFYSKIKIFTKTN